MDAYTAGDVPIPKQIRTSRPKYLLLGVTKQSYILMFGGDNLEAMEIMAEPLAYYSIYLNRPGLWSNVQREYLVSTRADPIWHTQPTEMSVH